MYRHLSALTRLALVVTALAFAAGTGPRISRAADQFISIGTGGVTGVYYPTGGAICRQVNKERSRHHIRCTVEATGGSVYNVKNVLAGELDFGIAQSDVQYKAVHGEDPFDSRQSKLRAVFSIHPETAILVVRAQAGIGKAQDMKGKRINIGNPGSGTLATAEVVLDAIGMKKDDLALAGDLRSSEHGDALRDNKIDGFFFLVGHPNGGLKDIFYSTEARLVPLVGPGFDKIVKQYPYYVKASTPGGIYRGVDKDVPTFAVKATFVNSADVPDNVVYELVKAVFDDLDSFKKLHPAYEHLTHEQMLEGLSAPLHPGAIKYYKEKGWM
jgi:hypothetical protein